MELRSSAAHAPLPGVLHGRPGAPPGPERPRQRGSTGLQAPPQAEVFVRGDPQSERRWAAVELRGTGTECGEEKAVAMAENEANLNVLARNTSL